MADIKEGVLNIGIDEFEKLRVKRASLKEELDSIRKLTDEKLKQPLTEELKKEIVELDIRGFEITTELYQLGINSLDPEEFARVKEIRITK